MINKVGLGILNGAKYGTFVGLIIWLGSGIMLAASGGGMIREAFTYTTFFVIYAAAIGATVGGIAGGKLGILRGLIFGGIFLPMVGCLGSIIFVIVIEVFINEPAPQKHAWLGWLPFLWIQFGPIVGAVIGAIMGGLSRVVKTGNNTIDVSN